MVGDDHTWSGDGTRGATDGFDGPICLRCGVADRGGDPGPCRPHNFGKSVDGEPWVVAAKAEFMGILKDRSESREAALAALPEDVAAEMRRIRSAFGPASADKEDLITYAKEVVALRTPFTDSPPPH